MLDLYDKISKSIDQKKCTVGIFIDLQKAFNTVDHDILLSKLSHYGIRGLVLDWFKSYLTDRYQYVFHNNESSTYKLVKCVVPQGSI